MKKLGELLFKGHFQKKVSRIDEKFIEKVFFDVLKKELPYLNRSDIRNFRLEDDKILLKAGHPAVFGEIWRKKEKIKSGINKLLEDFYIKDISVK